MNYVEIDETAIKRETIKRVILTGGKVKLLKRLVLRNHNTGSLRNLFQVFTFNSTQPYNDYIDDNFEWEQMAMFEKEDDATNMFNTIQGEN